MKICNICERTIDDIKIIKTTTEIGGIGRSYNCCPECLAQVYKLELHRLTMAYEKEKRANAELSREAPMQKLLRLLKKLQ